MTTKIVSATTRPVVALSDDHARKLLDLARAVREDMDAERLSALTSRACRIVGAPVSADAREAFLAFATLQQEWDARVKRILTMDGEPLPADARPTPEILHEATDALYAFFGLGD